MNKQCGCRSAVGSAPCMRVMTCQHTHASQDEAAEEIYRCVMDEFISALQQNITRYFFGAMYEADE